MPMPEKDRMDSFYTLGSISLYHGATLIPIISTASYDGGEDEKLKNYLLENFNERCDPVKKQKCLDYARYHEYAGISCEKCPFKNLA